jgi:effector-binding domain-containing protein
MESVGAAFAGPPVVLYQAMHDDGTVDVATGWPVEGQVPGGGRVEYATVPGGTTLVYSHRGPYDQLNRTHRALWELVEREGLTIEGAVREVYLSDPSEVPDPADWVTEIQMPIVRDEARIAALAGTSS